ncbi:ammonium transporter Rh type B [Harmonia axyridis]|uniref:ammonium transporter Rh type B n=1 Tax=Harmonia axyridis TaxID=115357 RepID=UPI001E2795B7|nr:ammonium transporter Rh type B [Harmonia axyridis]
MVSKKFAIIITLQFVLFILFLILGKYDEDYNVDDYPLFQDIHVMVFIGFGFLMTFLKRYAFSSLGFNFLLGAIMVQWSILCLGFYNLNEHQQIPINLKSLFTADISSCSVLISMGVILGTTTYLQLLMMGLVEIIFFSLNNHINSDLIKACDTGGSVVLHTFGAYFGMGVSLIIGRGKIIESKYECSRYTSDIFAMIGTIFLWLYWPSFNSISLQQDLKFRAIINTYLSLASSCVTTFAVSSWFNDDGKLEMVHIQNATLAGGVAIGSSASLLIQPYGAVLVGIIAGIISVVGYRKLTPWLDNKWNIHDTCGVHNLHGLPGVLGGLIGAFMACLATEEDYGNSLYELYPARSKIFREETINSTVGLSKENVDGRSAMTQTGFQMLSIMVTVLFASISGIVTGIFMNLRSSELSSDEFFMDIPFWKLDGDGDHADTIEVMPTAMSHHLRRHIEKII